MGFTKTGYAPVVLAAVLGVGGFFVGYKYHEANNPQQTVIERVKDSRTDELLKKCESYEAQLSEKDANYRKLQIELTNEETRTANAEKREVELRKKIALEPYKTEQEKIVLESKVAKLEGAASAHVEVDKADKARYELKVIEVQAVVAHKEATIAGLQGQLSVANAREEWFKAQYGTRIEQERAERARLERILNESGVRYTSNR